jgi:hypothetical protein
MISHHTLNRIKLQAQLKHQRMTTCPSNLRQAAFNANLSELQSMNLLQSAGIVSDNAVWFADVAEADVEKAVEYLKQ